jgi:hypothetical protein
MFSRLSVSILFVMIVSSFLLGANSQAPTHALPSSGASSSAPQRQLPPSKPSASCPQPDRHRSIASLSLQDRLNQGYPLPVNGHTDPAVDQVVHDRGVHFCQDTATPRAFRSSLSHIHPAASLQPQSESNSNVWAGNYADGGNNYTYVDSYWYESCILNISGTAAATWVGIGPGSGELVQTGVDAVGTEYVAFVENIGTGYNWAEDVFQTYCGDYIYAEVAQSNCMYIIDEGTGYTSGWVCHGPYANSATAECIEERPIVNGTLYEMANFHTETFDQCGVEINAGPTVGIGTVHHDYYNMYNGSDELASTGPIIDGNTYTITWHNYR